MDTYVVTGIVQSCIYGAWCERPIRTSVQALDRDAALALEADAARRIDPYATVRWHTPGLVGTALGAEHSTLSTMTARESIAQDNKTVI